MTIKHGHTVGNRWSREYRSYRCMLTRCYDEASGSYVRYGGVGISVCAEWRSDFRSFLRDVGSAPSDRHQLDRIDSRVNYEPGNVRWVTANENNRGRKNRTKVTIDGREVFLLDVARDAGLAIGVVESRIRNGWPIKQALSIPNLGSKKSRDPIIRALQCASIHFGVEWHVVKKRIQRGWSVRRAMRRDAACIAS